MAIWGNLHPHRYTGKLVAHQHTSYSGVAMLLLVCGLGLSAVTGGASAGTITGSGTITIGGTVPGPPPATAPEIVDPADGTHVVASPTALTGNCLSGLLVVIQRNGVDAGSTLCATDSTFGLSIELYNGRNDLIAIQYDSLNQASPPSPVTTVYFDQLSSQNPAAKPPTVGSSKPSVTPHPAAITPHPPLAILSKYNYQGAFAGTEVDLPVDISGGTTPYAVSIDWGDKQQTLLSQPENGLNSYPHTYAAVGNYTVTIRSADASGITGYYQTVILVNGLTPATTTAPTEPSVRLMVAWPIYAALLILVAGFWLGERYDANRWKHKLGTSN